METICLVPHFFEKKATKVAHAQCTVTKRKKKPSHSLLITAKVNGVFLIMYGRAHFEVIF